MDMQSKYFNIAIIHTDPRIASDVAHYFGNEHVFACTESNVKNIPIENTAFVSPSNSLLFMDGGIDYVYSQQMFPNVEKECKEIVRNLGLKTTLGRYYLPVGSAIVTSTGPTTCLISAPTMFLPHDVSETQNAYHAMMAALMAFYKYHKVHPEMSRIICPLLCTGYGKMPISTSAEQMKRAFSDFISGKVPKEIMFDDRSNVFITESRDNEQPNNFDNREIKDVPITSLRP